MSKMMLVLACFLSIALPVSATPLSDLAQSMAPGAWAELNTTNFTSDGAYGGGAPSTNGTDYIVNFSDDFFFWVQGTAGPGGS